MKIATFLALMVLTVFSTALGSNIWTGLGCMFAICTIGVMLDILLS